MKKICKWRKFTNHRARKTTDSKHCMLTYRQSHTQKKCKFPQQLRWGRRRRATTTLSCNIQTNLCWEKANIGSFRHNNNCGSTRPLMAALKENQLPPSFSSFNFNFNFNFSMNQATYGVVRNRQWWTLLNNSASSVFHLWLSEAFYSFQNSRILLAELS